MSTLTKPTIALVGINANGTFSARITVKYSGVTATGHYTLDGSTPSASHGTSFPDQIVVSNIPIAATIKAMSTKTGYNNSPLSSATLNQLVAALVHSPFGPLTLDGNDLAAPVDDDSKVVSEDGDV